MGNMDKEERVRELRKLLEESLAVPFPEAHKRIEELVGRPVWTHEMATPEYLYDEIMTGDKGQSFRKSTSKLIEGKKVIFIVKE